MLTSRQLAMVIWLAIFAVFVVVLAVTKKDVRRSILAILQSLSSAKLLALFATIIGYNVLLVWCLWRIGYWDTSMLYDTVVFIAVGGIGSVGRAATRGITYDRRFYLKTLLANLGLMVVLLFLIDLYPFNFWIEFFLVLPLATLIAMLVVVSEYQKGAEQAHRFLGGVQSMIGILLLIYVVARAVAEYQDLLHLQVLFALSLPFVMSLVFVPVLFLACAVFAYEDAFYVVWFKMNEDKQLARWKKRRLFLRFGLNLKALQEFRRSSAMQEYAWVKSKEEALECLP